MTQNPVGDPRELPPLPESIAQAIREHGSAEREAGRCWTVGAERKANGRWQELVGAIQRWGKELTVTPEGVTAALNRYGFGERQVGRATEREQMAHGLESDVDSAERIRDDYRVTLESLIRADLAGLPLVSVSPSEEAVTGLAKTLRRGLLVEAHWPTLHLYVHGPRFGGTAEIQVTCTCGYESASMSSEAQAKESWHQHLRLVLDPAAVKVLDELAPPGPSGSPSAAEEKP